MEGEWEESWGGNATRRQPIYGPAYFIGYDSMGFDLSKPRLRAEMESDLKRYYICVHRSIFK